MIDFAEGDVGREDVAGGDCDDELYEVKNRRLFDGFVDRHITEDGVKDFSYAALQNREVIS